MKKEFSFILIWEALATLLLFFSYKSIQELYQLRAGSLGTLGIVVLFYVIIGMLLFVLYDKSKNLTILGYLLISIYAIYLVIRVPLFYSENNIVFSLYPKWLLRQVYDFSTTIGGLLIGLIIISLIKYKVIRLGKVRHWIKKLSPYKWLILLIITITIGMVSYNSITIKERLVKQCINLIYDVPKLDGDMTSTDEYLKISTDQGFKHIINNGFDTRFKTMANAKNFTIDVIGIELDKVSTQYKGTDKESAHYNYIVKLDIESVDNPTKTIIYEEGSVNIEKNDGDWKVYFIKINNLNPLFKN